jgi:TPR repeat protein
LRKTNKARHQQAYELVKAGADAGNAYCKGYLGIMYMRGIVVERDKKKALELMQQAYDGGCIKIEHDLKRLKQKMDKK